MIEELFKLNCSTLFLLNPLGITRKDLEGTGFINCYLRDPSHPEYEGLNIVLLMFKPKNLEQFRFFVDREQARTPLFFDQYELENDFVVLVYEFPEQLSEDFERFKKGAYSEFSEAYRKTTPEWKDLFVKGQFTKQKTFQHMVINRLQIWKDFLESDKGLGTSLDDNAQFWSMPNMEDETIQIPPKKIAPEK